MQALYAQLLVGLINGSFYALLSLGLAVIFGILNIINFAHGALYDGRVRGLLPAQQ
jgi:branched-chain amino acid transport system permease protein